VGSGFRVQGSGKYEVGTQNDEVSADAACFTFAFIVQRSAFSVQRSAFSVQRSAFSVSEVIAGE
ncbi:MAG: hypothetical protein NTV22_04435, partial [bacterium]|nr:hypothetical protein [bacterium]